MNWTEIVKNARAKWAAAFCIITIVIIVLYMPDFLQKVISPKHGIYLNDPLFKIFVPVEWSWLIFTIIYLAILQTVVSVAQKPYLVLLGLSTYLGATLIRMATLYILTLEPPRDMILLIDPISTKFYPDSTFAKDLFFSGHICTMSVLFLIERNHLARILKLAGTVIIGVLLIWQHVHYTIDILTAPVITFVVFLAIRRFLEPTERTENQRTV